VSGVSVAVLLTCHNRVAATVRCLESLRDQRLSDVALQVYLVDAGSTDGTPETVEERFPATTVIRRDDDLFWCGGMRVALASAYPHDPDYYLWLNDDVVLDSDAMSTLLGARSALAARRRPPSIIVGSTRDPITGQLTYGGVSRPYTWRRLRYEPVTPGTQPRQAETMNGNCVLVPRDVVSRIGNLAAVYTHGMGDFDYGHRAGHAGCEVWVAPGTVGTCARDEPGRDAASFGQHRRQAVAPTTGLPPRDWMAFAHRWAGPLWVLYALSPYLLGWVRWMQRRRRAHSALDLGR
jgi:GT2 family glycosyltransferase